MQIFVGITVLLAAVVVAGVITALAVGAMRGSRRGSGSLGNAMLEVHALLEPEKRHVVESMREEREDETESGDDPLQSAPE